MIVERWMTQRLEVVGPNNTLQEVRTKMDAGHFRRVPVMEAGRLVGIVTDHDLAKYDGFLDITKAGAVMTQKLVTVSPSTMIERAAHLLLKHKIGGLPVVDQGKLAGIITATDLLRAFAEVLQGAQEGVSRVDLRRTDEMEEMKAVGLVGATFGEVLGTGSYRVAGKDSPVFYIRVRSEQASQVAQMLTDRGYEVLGVHS